MWWNVSESGPRGKRRNLIQQEPRRFLKERAMTRTCNHGVASSSLRRVRTTGSAYATTFIALSLILLTACAVGPKYKRPPVTVPDVYRGQPPDAGPPSTASFGDQK